ncbi:hypothetical protein [Sphingomonas oryzagri]
MLGLLAAFVAIYLGAAGPRFRWKGAAWLASIAILIGIVATLVARREASIHGVEFVVTPGSVLLGLVLQTAFMLTFYGMATLACWSWRGLTRAADEIPPADG